MSKVRRGLPRGCAKCDPVTAHRLQNGWDTRQVQVLRELWGKVRAPAIAELIGKTTMAVIGKADRMGLPRVPDEVRSRWAGHMKRSPYAPRLKYTILVKEIDA